MIKAEMNNPEVFVSIEPTLVLDENHENGVVRFKIELEDNVHPIVDEYDVFNTFSFEVFGVKALIELVNTLNIYIDTMKLREQHG